MGVKNSGASMVEGLEIINSPESSLDPKESPDDDYRLRFALVLVAVDFAVEQQAEFNASLARPHPSLFLPCPLPSTANGAASGGAFSR